MAWVYGTTLANNRLTQDINAIDGGAGSGILKIYNAARATLLVSITLAKPSFGTPASKSMTMAGTPLSGNPAAAGTAAIADFCDSTGAAVISGLTVGTSGSDINLNTVTIAVGIPVTISSGTITHP